MKQQASEQQYWKRNFRASLDLVDHIRCLYTQRKDDQIYYLPLPFYSIYRC